MTDTEIPDPDDMGLAQTWFSPWNSASMKAQATQVPGNERFLIIAGDLTSQGLLDTKSLYKSINFVGSQDCTGSVMTVYKLLSSFTLGSDCLEDSDLPGKPFRSPRKWLFNITCRSFYY